jgi:hypothetical protein
MEIPRYEGIYYIEPNGDIYSMDRIVEGKDGKFYFKEGQLIKPLDDGNGYYVVTLCKNNIRKHYKVHRLLALTYIENPNNYPCVNHKDCNRQNNNLDNLEWCTHEYNTQSINTTKNFGGVSFYKDRKKCYVARYNLNKIFHSKYFKTKEEAQSWLDEQMLEILKNNLINN